MPDKPQRMSTRSDDIRSIVAFACGVGSSISFVLMPSHHHPWQSSFLSLYWGLMVLGGVVGGCGAWKTVGMSPIAVTLGHLAGGLIWAFMIPHESGPDSLFGLFVIGLIVNPLFVSGITSLIVTAIWNAVPANQLDGDAHHK